MPYRFLEKIATADVAIEATGKTLEELFTSAAMAVEEVMADLKTISPRMEKEIKLENEKIDQLPLDFLEELVFLKDTEQLLFNKFMTDIKINKKNKKYILSAKASGEKIDFHKQKVKADVKAVTYHLFALEETKEGWKTRIILDI